MRGGRAQRSFQDEAVIREYHQALRLGAHEYAAKIKAANPDLLKDK